MGQQPCSRYLVQRTTQTVRKPEGIALHDMYGGIPKTLSNGGRLLLHVYLDLDQDTVRIWSEHDTGESRAINGLVSDSVKVLLLAEPITLNLLSQVF